LEATLAPFEKAEKPQLSTRLAASLIKNGPHVRGLALDGIVSGFAGHIQK